jgi:hypothetical protein
MNTLIGWVGRRMPGQFVGALEYYMRPGIKQTWGGPFNGQCFRRRMVGDLLRLCPPAAIVETGTYRGETTAFFAKNSPAPVFTTEANRRSFSFASRRLRRFKNVTVHFMDSRKFLKNLKLSTDLPVFFYLDAHWGPDVPLQEETAFIFEKFSNFLIMIDDFQVPGDCGYGYDDYGLGKRLSLSDFPFHQTDHVSLYFPNCPSHAESGSRRGCILLASRSQRDRVAQVKTLRPYDPR